MNCCQYELCRSDTNLIVESHHTDVKPVCTRMGYDSPIHVRLSHCWSCLGCVKHIINVCLLCTGISQAPMEMQVDK